MLNLGCILYALEASIPSIPLIDLGRKWMLKWWWWIDDDDWQTLIAWPSLTGFSQASTAKRLGPYHQQASVAGFRVHIAYVSFYKIYFIKCCHFLPFSSQFLYFLFYFLRWLLTCHNVNRNWSQLKSNSRRSICLQLDWGLGTVGTIYVWCIYLAFCFHLFSFLFILFVFFSFYFGMTIFWFLLKEGLTSLNPWFGWLRLNPALYLSYNLNKMFLSIYLILKFRLQISMFYLHRMTLKIKVKHFCTIFLISGCKVDTNLILLLIFTFLRSRISKMYIINMNIIVINDVTLTVDLGTWGRIHLLCDLAQLWLFASYKLDLGVDSNISLTYPMLSISIILK